MVARTRNMAYPRRGYDDRRMGFNGTYEGNNMGYYHPSADYRINNFGIPPRNNGYYHDRERDWGGRPPPFHDDRRDRIHRREPRQRSRSTSSPYKRHTNNNQRRGDPISKESEDTLRNRIRNETQLQEERDKEHQCQVKDKVRELQKKLTAPEPSSSSTSQEHPSESSSERNGASISSERNGPSTSCDSNRPSTSSERNGPSTSSERNGPSTSSERNGPSTSSERNGPSTSSERNGPSTSSERNGPSTSSERNGPSTSSECNGPSTSSSLLLPPQIPCLGPELHLSTPFHLPPPPLLPSVNQPNQRNPRSSSSESSRSNRSNKSNSKVKKKKKQAEAEKKKKKAKTEEQKQAEVEKKQRKAKSMYNNFKSSINKPVLSYDNFKASIAKKDPKYLKELIESPTFLKKVLMTKLVEEHRKHISDKLTRLRFENSSNENEGESEKEFLEVNFKELPLDFLAEISHLIQKQSLEEVTTNGTPDDSGPPPSVSAKISEDEDIMEVPVPPKTPPPFVNLSDGEDVSEENGEKRGEDGPKLVFANKLSSEVEIMNAEEKRVLERLEVLSAEKKELNEILLKIAETRNKLLIEAASLLQSSR